jgi:hypothetical protein
MGVALREGNGKAGGKKDEGDNLNKQLPHAGV